MNSKLLKDVLLNVRRLMVKGYIKSAIYKKAVGLLRVGMGVIVEKPQ